jgi:hypothetical protein
MDKELCFFINGNALFLDKVLVAFNDTPIFFICCDNDNNYYIALCTDLDVLEYIVVKSSLQMLYKLLTQKVEMRAPFVQADYYWDVKAGESVYEDEVECLSIENMDMDVLPYATAVYETINEDDVVFVDKVKSLYFDTMDFTLMELAPNTEVPANSVVEISLDYLQPVTQYFDFSPVSRNPFSGVVKRFECSCYEESSVLFYGEPMEDRRQTRISSNFTNEILVESLSSLADAA